MKRREFKTKDTRATIMEYAKELEDQIIAGQEGKFDPIAVKEVERKKEVVVKAEKLIGRDIVSETIKNEYTALEERIADMKAEITELTTIEVSVNTLAVLVEANNVEIAAAKAEKDEIIATKKQELADLEADYIARKNKLIADENAKIAELKQTREREKAEHDYDKERNEKLENDTWADTKATREKVLADKEDAVTERELTCKEIEEVNFDLRSAVDAIPATIAQAKTDAETAANAQATKIFAIKEAAMKKEVEFNLKMKEAELTNANALNAKLETEVATLNAKLESAYVQMNELATKTVQAAQPVYMNKESK
jgi:hypothetical protein